MVHKRLLYEAVVEGVDDTGDVEEEAETPTAAHSPRAAPLLVPNCKELKTGGVRFIRCIFNTSLKQPTEIDVAIWCVKIVC